MKLTTLVLPFVLLAGCATTADNFYDDAPTEPALDASEVSALPDGSELEHAADLEAELAALPPVDDASAYDDDVVEAMVDAEVTDTPAPDPSAPSFDAALLHWGLHPRASD